MESTKWGGVGCRIREGLTQDTWGRRSRPATREQRAEGPPWLEEGVPPWEARTHVSGARAAAEPRADGAASRPSRAGRRCWEWLVWICLEGTADVLDGTWSPSQPTVTEQNRSGPAGFSSRPV